MRSPQDEFDTLTLNLPFPVDGLLRAQLALTHQGKNLYNTGLFMLRQVLSAYAYDAATKTSVLKAEIHDEQRKAIDFYNTHIAQINAKRIAKFPDQCAKADASKKQAPQLKLVPLLTPVMEKLSSSMLDATVLDNVARHWKNGQGEAVYRRLPGVMAQQVMKKLGENFSSFFMASARFHGSPSERSGMTGRPRMPGYLGKNERFTLDVPLASVHGTFPRLKGKTIPEDYRETSVLSPEMIAAFDGYDVTGAIEKACKKRGWAEFEPQHLRIVPMRHTVKMEVVVRVKNAYPAGSFLAGLVKAHGKDISSLKNDKAREKWLDGHLAAIPHASLPRIASMDLGVNNLVSVAYSTGHKAAVHTGGRFEAVLKDFTDRIDARISRITPERAKELQGKKNALCKDDKRLEKAEHVELNTLLKEVYEDSEYRRLVGLKKRWIHDFLHKISRALVEHCKARGIEVIVIGKNKGWKDEVNLGRVENRRFCQIAYATLITLTKYKAQALGMAVVTTEESYTSKTSFVNGDTLENYEEKVAAQNAGAPLESARKTGYRSSSDRNRFVHKNRIDRLKVVHSDVNGAFNIIRKVFKSFKYHAGLTLKYTLYRLSPRLGVVGIRSLQSG